MIIVNGFQRSILDVAAVLDLSLAQLLLRNMRSLFNISTGIFNLE